MKHDPYWRQRQVKSSHRNEILRHLRDTPSTFGELLERTGRSRPVLTGYLRELERDGVIVRRFHEHKRLYELTEAGKAFELMRTNTVATGFRAAGSIIHDEKSAELFVDLARLAKERPEAFQAIMDFALNLVLFTTSDPVFESRWLRVLGGNKDELRPFQDEVQRRISKSQLQPKTSQELREALDDVLDGIKQTFAACKRGTK